MQRPVHIKTIIGSILFFVLFFLSITLTVRAAEAATLLAMDKQENPNHTRIIFQLSDLPEFTTDRSGQRISLKLKQVEAAADLHDLPEDEAVVKILLAQKHEELLVSLLLRRPPQQVYTETQTGPNRIVMDIYWAADESSRPAVAFRISDMPPKKAGRRAARFQRKSPWDGRWYDFYRSYRSDWKLDLPLKFSLPKLPPLISDRNSPLWPLQEHADLGMFLSLLKSAGSLSDLNDEQRFQRNLLVAEAQLRTGAVDAANARLLQMKETAGPNAARVGYLTAYGEALDGQPLVAGIRLQELLPQLKEEDPFVPYLRLLAAETTLSSKRDKEGLEQLDKVAVWPDAFLQIAELRRADLLAGSGRLEDALAIYADLVEETGLYEAYRFSCNRAAFTAFKQGNYSQASDLYRKLSEQLKDQPGEGLALFATGASAFEAGDSAWGMIGLQRATLDRPGSEGADRAALRLIDLGVIKGGELGLAKAVGEYAELGQKSDYRPVREEAVFKKALGLYLLKEHKQSVDELMLFRRNYATSKFKREVDLLLLEQLPKVVHSLLQEKDDLSAVVLVEKNRKLLLSGEFDQPFLQDLAMAFEKLGLYDRAGRVLLYLFDHNAGKPAQQEVYLPLARSFAKRKEYEKAGDYAGRYLKKYPQGEDAGALFGILLDSFDRQKRDQDLLGWLDDKTRPRSVDLEKRAAWIYWKLGKMNAVIDSLEWIKSAGHELGVKEMALLAEAYFQLDKNSQAEKNYRLLREDPGYGTQALYRGAQLLLRKRDRGAAMALLKKAVEVDTDGPWGKLAQDLLIQEQR